MKAAKLGAMAANAIALELATTIKPGLVDRKNNGAYKDLDYFTCLNSIRALTPWFVEFALMGLESSKLSPTELFSEVRSAGVKAEAEMFRATGGINAHKGVLFSLGLCVASAGRILSGKMFPDPNSVCLVAAEMVSGICQRELETLDLKIKLIGENILSQGEKMYMKFKSPGARGEAESGFITIRKYALPVMRKLEKNKSVNKNDMYVQTFMTLMANTLDTGILAKEGIDAAEEIKDRAGGILDRGGQLTPLGKEKIAKLDDHLLERKLIPKASANLLTVAIFLHLMEEDFKFRIY